MMKWDTVSMIESTSIDRVLIIEDDETVAKAISDELKVSYRVAVAASGEDGLKREADFHPQLVVLDLTLPGIGGLDVLKTFKARSSTARVLILTSMNAVEDRVRGLQGGADDYLGKPFSLAELTARVNALLRRDKTSVLKHQLHVADLLVDLDSRSAARAGAALPLTPREFDLLVYLAEHLGRAVSRDMLSRDIWQETSRFTPIDNVIDVQFTRLRRKLDDPFPVKLLHTVRGVGYMLRQP